MQDGETPSTDTDGGETAVVEPPERLRRIFRGPRTLIALAAAAALAGSVGAWKYDAGLRNEPKDNNVAMIGSGADLSSYVSQGVYTEMTVPIRNDSPDAITIVGLKVLAAPRLAWEGPAVRVQPGSTVFLRVKAPDDCPAVPHRLKSRGAVTVLVRVETVNGRVHDSLRAGDYGVIQYAYDYCAVHHVSASTVQQR
jgi:hypothetical protein